MKEETFSFSFKVYDDIRELSVSDRELLQRARDATAHAYAPYSKFYVGAAARLSNGEILHSANQENASFPVGICAERVLLSTVSSIYPGIPIESIAISYRSENIASDHPISPCGMCRQSLSEFEERMLSPIRLVLGGLEGKIYVLSSVGLLLPLCFTSDELN